MEKSKESYYLALRKTQSSLKTDSPDFNPWLIFFLKSLQKQKRHLEHKVTKEKLLLSFPESTVQVLELISQHGRLKISELEKMTGGNRNTLKKQLAGLVSKGILFRLGKGKATWYTLP